MIREKLANDINLAANEKMEKLALSGRQKLLLGLLGGGAAATAATAAVSPDALPALADLAREVGYSTKDVGGAALSLLDPSRPTPGSIIKDGLGVAGSSLAGTGRMAGMAGHHMIRRDDPIANAIHDARHSLAIRSREAAAQLRATKLRMDMERLAGR